MVQGTSVQICQKLGCLVAVVTMHSACCQKLSRLAAVNCHRQSKTAAVTQQVRWLWPYWPPSWVTVYVTVSDCGSHLQQVRWLRPYWPPSWVTVYVTVSDCGSHLQQRSRIKLGWMSLPGHLAAGSRVRFLVRLQALVYNILPSTTAMYSYIIGSWNCQLVSSFLLVLKQSGVWDKQLR